MPKTTSIPADFIRIIAEVGSRLPRQYDDHIAVALLKYLQAQAAEAKQAIPSLELYFSEKYPAIDLGLHIVNALHNTHPELQKPDIGHMTEEEYREVCGSVFPPVVLKFYPTPSDYLDPYRNLFPLWILELGKKVAEEVKCCPAAVRLAFGMVRDYIFLCANDWPGNTSHWFFIMWNVYLLSRKWPERIAELEAALQDERDYNHAAEIMLAQQSKRIVELRKAGEEHYITLTDAAKRALEVEFGRQSWEERPRCADDEAHQTTGRRREHSAAQETAQILPCRGRSQRLGKRSGDQGDHGTAAYPNTGRWSSAKRNQLTDSPQNTVSRRFFEILFP